MMDPRSEGHGNELRDELEALRKRLEDLEAIHAGRKDTVNSSYRRGFSRGLASGLVPMAVVIVLTASLLYGQSAVDALFIDQQGRVGIGTTTPAKQLDVQGTEIHSGGSGGGLSFGNRNSPFVETPGSGERWVWYSQNGTARLWSGSDKVSVTTNGNVRINSLQIGNTVIAESELQILKKLAAGQLVVDLFNTSQQEYLYAADCCAYDKDRRSVFTWKPKGRINQGYWQLQYAR